MRASYVNPTVIKEKGSVKEYNDGTLPCRFNFLYESIRWD